MRKILLFLFLIITGTALAETYTSQATAGDCSGNWSDSDCWLSSGGDNGVPSFFDIAVIANSTTINVDTQGTIVGSIQINSGGTLNVSNSLTALNSSSNSFVSGTLVVAADMQIGAGNFAVNSGGLITIGSGKDLLYNVDDVTFTNNGTVTVSSNSSTYGTIIFPSTIAGSGAFQYKLYLPAKTSPWELAGAPFTGQTVQNFMTNNSNLATNGSNEFTDERGVGPFSNSDHSWTTWTYNEASGQVFTAGKGFQMASESGSTVTFQGTFNTSDVDYTITSNESDPFTSDGGSRYELLSNPFPAYLALNSSADSDNNFLATNLSSFDSGANQVVWAWNGSANGGGTFTTYSQSDSATYIAPGQGFFVGAAGSDGATGTVTFTTAMVKQNSNDDGFYDVLDEENRGELFVNINQSTFDNFTKIFFLESGTDMIDAGYDGNAFTTNLPVTIYSRPVDPNSQSNPQTTQINNLGSQTLAYSEMWDKVIPLGINALGGEEMTISISHRTTPADLNIYLEDTEEGTMTNLLDGDFVYTPTSDLEGVGRFFIHMSADTMSNEDVSTSMLNAYKEVDASYITIEGLATQSNETKVSLYNILGREVLATTLNNNMGTQTISTVGLSAGIYVIELESGSDRLTKKLLIQ